jgi:hypothetical protein
MLELNTLPFPNKLFRLLILLFLIRSIVLDVLLLSIRPIVVISSSFSHVIALSSTVAYAQPSVDAHPTTL